MPEYSTFEVLLLPTGWEQLLTFSDQQSAVTRTWDTSRGAHTHIGRNEKLLLNNLKFTQWDPYARWHPVWKLEKKINWKRARFRWNQALKIASLERHSKLNTLTLQGSCLKCFVHSQLTLTYWLRWHLLIVWFVKYFSLKNFLSEKPLTPISVTCHSSYQWTHKSYIHADELLVVKKTSSNNNKEKKVVCLWKPHWKITTYR